MDARMMYVSVNNNQSVDTQEVINALLQVVGIRTAVFEGEEKLGIAYDKLVFDFDSAKAVLEKYGYKVGSYQDDEPAGLWLSLKALIVLVGILFLIWVFIKLFL